MNKIQFECNLQNPKAVYRSGDNITGTILVEFSEVTKIRGKLLNPIMHAVMRYHFLLIISICVPIVVHIPLRVANLKRVIKIGEKTTIKIFESGENAI